MKTVTLTQLYNEINDDFWADLEETMMDDGDRVSIESQMHINVHHTDDRFYSLVETYNDIKQGRVIRIREVMYHDEYRTHVDFL